MNLRFRILAQYVREWIYLEYQKRWYNQEIQGGRICNLFLGLKHKMGNIGYSVSCRPTRFIGELYRIVNGLCVRKNRFLENFQQE